MPDVPDLLRISPTVNGYLNAVLSGVTETDLVEALRQFEAKLPGSADRGDEDKRLAVAVRRAVEFVTPTVKAILGPGKFFDQFPVPARPRKTMTEAVTDGQVVGLAWADAEAGAKLGGTYRPTYGWAYGAMAQEVAQEVRDRSGAYRRHRKAITPDEGRVASQAILAVANLALAREAAASAQVAYALHNACLADPNLSDGVQAVIVETVDEMLKVQSTSEHFAALREQTEAARQRLEESQRRYEEGRS